MADVKNFGLIGVGSSLQFSKGGAKLVNNAGTFNFKAANGTTDSAATASALTATTGDLTATSGNLVLSALGGTVSIGGTNVLQLTNSLPAISGTAAVVLPSGTTLQRPTATGAGAGAFRYNTSGILEYSDGTNWVSVATGGTAVTSISVATANGFAGTSSGGPTPTLTLSTGVTGFLVGDGTGVSAAVSGTDIKTVNGTSLLGSGDLGTITVAYGGTGLTSLTTNGVVFGNATSAAGVTAAGTQYQVLQAGAGGTPSFGALQLDQSAAVSGILAGANGGTGVDNTGKTITLGGNLTTSGAYNSTFTMTGNTSVTFPTSGTLLSTANIAGSAVTSISFGTTGLTPSSAANGIVTVDGTLVAANGGTGIASYTAGDMLYASGSTAFSKLSIGSAGQALVVSGGSPSWQNVVNSVATSGAGISVDNATGTSTFTLSSGLESLSGITAGGFAVYNSTSGTWSAESITGTAGNIVVTHGDGQATSPSIDLAPITQGSGSNFDKITLDGFGRVVGSTAVVQSDLTSLLGTYYLPEAGGTMSGNIAMGSNSITGLADPVNPQDAATKNYVDSALNGLSWKQAVKALSTTDITAGGSTPLVIDGYTVQNGDRVLVTAASGSAAGIYVVTIAGGAYTLARSADCATYQELTGAAVFVVDGSTYIDTGWTQQTDLTAFTGQVWVQFSSASGTYAAGTALTLAAGNVFNVNYGQGIAIDGSNALTANIATGTALSKTSGLAIVLDATATGGLDQTGGALRIKASSVTNAMLATPSITLDGDAGSTGTVSLGGTLDVVGTAVQGISTTVSGSTYTITAANASSSQKGVASFTDPTFVVTSGNVDIASGGVTNGMLANSSFAITGDAGSTDTVALGGSFHVKGDGSFITSTTGAGGVDLSIGVLAPANGGTGVANSNTITLAGNFATAGANSLTLTTTGTTNVTLPTSGTLATTAGTVASFSTGSTGLLANGSNTAQTGAVTLSGTLDTANGGTGLTAFVANEVFYAGSTSTVDQSANFTFDGTSTLTVGGAKPLAFDGATGAITATATNSDIVLMPDGTGSVIVGPVGAGLIQSDAGMGLTVRGNTTLTLASGTGSTSMVLASGTANKVDVSGPNAADYATGLADTNLVNKYYVDQAIATGAEKGAVKAFQATILLSADGTTSIGTAMPAGATVLSVKVMVTTADLGSTTLTVGKTGSLAAYMSDTENDPQSNGLYFAECFVTESGSVQLKATVAGSAGGSGSCVVIVTYQVAQ